MNRYATDNMKTSVEVRKTTTSRERADFVHVPHIIYKDVEQYVYDLESDISKMVEPGYSPDGDVKIQGFVAYKDGKPAGRILGFMNRRTNEIWGRNEARFSLIEFVDDKEVSTALIKAVEDWAREVHADSIIGPMGITDFDKEGMLIEDFELQGSFIEYYNMPYYKDHMVSLGYDKAADWVQIQVDVPKEVPARYARVARYVREELGLKVVRKSKREIANGYGDKIFDLLNQSFAPLFGFTKFSREQQKEFLNGYLPILDLELITLIENEKDELVGIAITMADISYALNKAKGRLLPFGWYHLLKALKWDRPQRAELMVIGVRPDYQGLGVNALVFDNLIPIYNRKGIRMCETGPQLEDNVRELSQWKPLGPRTVKRRRCWQKKLQ